MATGLAVQKNVSGIVTTLLATVQSFMERQQSRIALVTLAVAFSTTFWGQAYAQTDPAAMLKNICTYITGAFGQSIALLGLVGVGLAWMFGRASLGLIAGVIGGIIVIFGAASIVTTVTG